MNLDALLLILQHIANICERELVNTVLLAPAQNRGLWLKPHLVYRERCENEQEKKWTSWLPDSEARLVAPWIVSEWLILPAIVMKINSGLGLEH